MIAKCIATTLVHSGEESREPRAIKTSFDIEIGADYRVYGLMLFDSKLRALVCASTGTPFWIPMALFELKAQSVPSHWMFGILERTAATRDTAVNSKVPIWGYRELVRNPSHSDELIDAEPGALDIFFTEAGRVALANGLEAALLSQGLDDVLQLTEVISRVSAYLIKDPHDPYDRSVRWVTAKAVQQILERGYVVAGDLGKRENGSLFVSPWHASPAATATLIRERWEAMEEPRNLNDIVWLELTAAGRKKAQPASL